MKPNALALAVLTAALVLSGCKDSAKPGAQTAPSAPALTEAATGEPAVAPVDPLTVSVPPGFGAEIRVAPVGATPLSDTLRVAGKVDFDETRVTRIGATVTGRVIEIHAQLGQQVKVGDALAVINSTELGQAQLAYLKARAQADLQAQFVVRALGAALGQGLHGGQAGVEVVDGLGQRPFHGADHHGRIAVLLIADFDLGRGDRNDLDGLRFLLGIHLAGVEYIGLILLPGGLAANENSCNRESQTVF